MWDPLALTFFQRHGCLKNLYHHLTSFLSNRKIAYRTKVSHVYDTPTLGSPQGSPISPLLWNVVINGLLKIPMPPNVNIQAYADDTAITICPTNSALKKRQRRTTKSAFLGVYE